MQVKEPPLGMSLEESLARKRRFKRSAWIQFVLFFLLFSLIMEYLGHLGGWYVTLEEKTLANLEVARGILYAEERRSRIRDFRVGLKDEGTGTVMLKLSQGLCRGYETLKKYSGHKAIVWYYREPGYGVNWIYQLEVGGQVICDLETANKNVVRRNQDKFWFWFRLGWPLVSGVVVGLFCYLLYRKNLNSLDEEGNRK